MSFDIYIYIYIYIYIGKHNAPELVKNRNKHVMIQIGGDIK